MDFQVQNSYVIEKSFGFFCVVRFLTLECFAVSEDESPEIIGPGFVQIKTHPGNASSLF